MPATPPTRKIEPKIQKLTTALLEWFAVNARDLPWRRTDDPYAIWVSEIMLQQTQVKTVVPFWNRWMRELPTIESVANASSDQLHKLWEGLGYYTRVRNLQKSAQTIVAQSKSSSGRREEALIKISNRQSAIGNSSETPHVVTYKFPEKFEDVLALSGIGRYTAGAICSIAFNQPTPILDGNVIRVLTRIFGITENPKDKATNARLWQLAEELVLNSKLKTKNSKFCCSHLNQSLMELGALICTPRQPQCLLCPVQKLCVAFKEKRTEELPNLGKRETATARRFVAFVVEHDGKFLVRQRPAGVVNAQLWEFPNLETGKKTDEAALEFFGMVPKKIKPLCTVKHSITRYRITLESFAVEIKTAAMKTDGVWKSPAQLQSLAFTAAHRKILRTLTGTAA